MDVDFSSVGQTFHVQFIWANNRVLWRLIIDRINCRKAQLKNPRTRFPHGFYVYLYGGGRLPSIDLHVESPKGKTKYKNNSAWSSGQVEVWGRKEWRWSIRSPEEWTSMHSIRSWPPRRRFLVGNHGHLLSLLRCAICRGEMATHGSFSPCTGWWSSPLRRKWGSQEPLQSLLVSPVLAFLFYSIKK